jgi:hypothetical protein
VVGLEAGWVIVPFLSRQVYVNFVSFCFHMIKTTKLLGILEVSYSPNTITNLQPASEGGKFRLVAILHLLTAFYSPCTILSQSLQGKLQCRVDTGPSDMSSKNSRLLLPTALRQNRFQLNSAALLPNGTKFRIGNWMSEVILLQSVINIPPTPPF